MKVKIEVNYFDIPEDVENARVSLVEDHEDRAIIFYDKAGIGGGFSLPSCNHGLDARSMTRKDALGTEEFSSDYNRETIVKFSFPVETAQRLADEINSREPVW